MTAKEYLQQAFRIAREIRVRISELEAMRSALHGRGVRYDGSGGEPADNTLEKALCRVIDRERELDREIFRLVEKKSEISDVINRVSDVRLRELLIRRYLGFEKWEIISAEMHTDLRWLFRLHDRALRSIAKLIRN